MVVFLVGGESRLMDALITKMEKDGHKTYLLTGKRDGRGKYRRVFERYNFPYDSESVREIFSNVNPDLVIFLGAYDTNYDWSDARRESVRFTADLTNLLSAYAFNPKGRFVYLSSEAVYGRSYMADIHETEPLFCFAKGPFFPCRGNSRSARHPPKAFRRWRSCRAKISARATVTRERWTHGFCGLIICMIFRGKEKQTTIRVSR